MWQLSFKAGSGSHSVTLWLHLNGQLVLNCVNIPAAGEVGKFPPLSG